MEFILNPIVVSVVVLCALCLARVNVLLALIAASLVAGLTGGLGLTKSMELLSGGFSANATTALSYILLGTFAVAIAHTGLMQMLVRWIGAKMGGQAARLLLRHCVHRLPLAERRARAHRLHPASHPAASQAHEQDAA